MNNIILIVEDEEDVLDLLKISFELDGNKVLIATDGEMGYALATKHKPDIMIIDIKLPKINGYDLCRMLREEESTLNIPIIIITILTSDSSKSDEEWAKALGVEAFFTKPFEPHKVVNKVKEILAA